MKKLLIFLGVVFLLILLAAGGAAAYFLLQPGGTLKEKAEGLAGGQSRLLDYLGEQVVGIANAQLVPELSYETIRYDPPYGLALGGVKLTAPDGTDVLDLGSMTVTLAEVPKVGQPIKIASIAMSNGAVNLIRDESVGGLRGFSPLMEPKPQRQETTLAKPEFKLSNVLVLSKLTIEGIDLVYDAGDGSSPMRLDALSADLDIVPDDVMGEGRYDLALKSGRKPGLELDVDGKININTFELALDSVVAETKLDDQAATTLPQQLASIVNQYQLRGDLKANISGRIPLLEPGSAELDIRATLDDGRSVFGEYQIPLQAVSIDGRLASGILDLANIQATALGGTANANGRIVFGGDASLEWNVSGMKLRELLASRPTDQPPRFAGLMNSSGRVRFPLQAPTGGISGAGDIDITQGRLTKIKVVTDIVEVMEATGLLRGNTFRDTFKSPITLSPTGLSLDGFEFSTPAVTARGSGTIGFDQSLDMRVNGGPIEAIQKQLGDFGKILGALTDSVLKYRVRGTISEPKISVQPLGIGG